MVSCITNLRREASNCLELRLKILTNAENTLDETPHLYFVLRYKSHRYINSQCHDTYIAVQDTKNSNAVPFDLETFRDYLYKKFDVPKNSRILYEDNDGDELPIDSQCEFMEAWKFARSYAKKNAAVLLLIDCPFPNDNYTVTLNDENLHFPYAYKEGGVMLNPFLSQVSHKNIHKASKSRQQEDKYKVQNMEDVRDFLRSLNAMLDNPKPVEYEDETANKTNSENPPLWFEEYMKTMKEDIVNEVTSRVTTTMTELLNKFSANLLTELRPNQTKEDSIPTNTPNVRYSSDDEAICSYPVERKQHKKKAVNRIYYRIESFKEKMRNATDRQKYYCHGTEMVNNLDKGYKKQEECDIGQNCVRQEVFSNVNLPLLNPQIDDNMYHIQKCADSELRMNCSITGHQILDNAKGTMFCSSELDNFSICNGGSNNTDLHDEHNFEVIQMPQCEFNVLDCRNLVTDVQEQKIENVSTIVMSNANTENNGSGRDSPSFELLSESPSPPVSLYMDDDHFSANENDSTRAMTATPTTDSIEKVSNEESKPEYVYVIGVDGKIYYKYLFDDTKKCIDDLDYQKRMDGLYSFVAQTLPTNIKSDVDLSKSEYTEHKCESDPNIDVKSSHTSYTMQKGNAEWSKMTQHNSCHLQPDMNEFTQSFHSHTTSVTDDENRVTGSTGSTCDNDQNDIANDLNQLRRDSASKTNFKSTKNTETNDHTSTTENTRSYSTHTSGFSSQHTGNRPAAGADARMLGVDLLNTVDSVYILPEALVTSAAHAAFLAYGTARNIIDKLRLHTKDERPKRRNWR